MFASFDPSSNKVVVVVFADATPVATVADFTTEDADEALWLTCVTAPCIVVVVVVVGGGGRGVADTDDLPPSALLGEDGVGDDVDFTEELPDVPVLGAADGVTAGSALVVAVIIYKLR